MKFLKSVVAQVVDLKANLFVRKELDQDHVLYLAELVEGGVEMNSKIKVTEDMTLIDGRHRKEAFELAKVTEIKVDVYKIDDETELIAEAYKANTGGSKPPTVADTEHTIMLLLDRGESMKRIGEMLVLPASMARKYAGEVKSRMNRAKLQRAAEAVTEGGLTVSKAAEQHNVDADKLKEVLSGHKRKHKSGVVEVQRQLTVIYRGLAQRNVAVLRKMTQKFEDGDVSKKQVEEIIRHIKSLLNKSSKTVTEWETRFLASATNGKENEKLSKLDKLSKTA